MFTSLFSNIGLRSLISALLLGIALLVAAAWWLWPIAVANSQATDWPIWQTLIIGVILLGSSWLNTEVFNRLYLFAGQYLSVPLFLALLLGFFSAQDWMEFFLIPIGLALALAALIITLRAGDLRRPLFAWSFLVALLMWWWMEFVLLLPAVWLILVFQAKLEHRVFLASLLGWGAGLYLGMVLGDLSEGQILGLSSLSFESLKFSTPNLEHNPWSFLLLLPTAGTFMVGYSLRQNTNQEQRAVLQFLVLFQILGVLTWLFLGQSKLWLTLSLWPQTILWCWWIVSQTNRWLRDLSFLFLLSFFLLSFLA